MIDFLLIQAEELLLTHSYLSTSLLMCKFHISRPKARNLLKTVSKKRRRFKLVTKDLLKG